MSNNLFVAYFPYLCMRDVSEIDLGFIKIWNFSKKKDIYISNPNVKAKVARILQTHTSHWSPLEGIGIVSIGDTDFREFTSDELKNIRLARLILFLCFLSENNTHNPYPNVGHWMATSENFDVVFQNFLLDDEHISEQTGAIISFLTGGYKLGEVKFQKPGFVPTPMRFSVDNNLLKGFLELKNKKPHLFNRIINASEIFLESYYNSPSVSRNARILLQMSAFEILLNLPEVQQRMYFKKAIRDYTVFSGEKVYTHYSERYGKKVKERLTKKEIWADTFYVLRNHIIHGANPSEKEFIFNRKQLHTDISLSFFILCIKKLIEKKLRKYPCENEIKWKRWYDNLNLRYQEGFPMKNIGNPKNVGAICTP